MSIRTFLSSAVCAIVLAGAMPVAVSAQGVPAQGAASAPAGEAELQAAITKSNAYTALMNRTLRAIQSWERYASWVDMKKADRQGALHLLWALQPL